MTGASIHIATAILAISDTSHLPPPAFVRLLLRKDSTPPHLHSCKQLRLRARVWLVPLRSSAPVPPFG